MSTENAICTAECDEFHKTSGYAPLDDDGLVTITLTRRQRRLMRNTFSAHVQDEDFKLREQCLDQFDELFAPHMVLLKEIVNILFDEPEYKEFCDLPIDEPHVHLAI